MMVVVVIVTMTTMMTMTTTTMQPKSLTHLMIINWTFLFNFYV